MKICTHCNKEMPLSEFPFRKERGNYNSYCYECRRKQGNERNKRNPFPHRESNKRYMERHPERWKKIEKQSRLKNAKKIKEKRAAIIKEAPHKYKARKAINHKIELGKLKKPKKCTVNNRLCSKQIEAHHVDYSKPLDVIWLCSRHHKSWHRVFKPEE